MTHEDRKTNLHAMRFTNALWKELTTAATAEGVSVSEITRDFYAWWLRKPGAKLPKRPDATT